MNKTNSTDKHRTEATDVEEHPLEPFLPPHARLLMLGSFPPQKKRWCMEFYYPNWINDMWRLMGFIVCGDRNAFVKPEEKTFNRERIIQFLTDYGIALYDTASAVRRLKDNASDKFLEVVKPTDIHLLLKQIPECCTIVVTGEKACETICAFFGQKEIPPVGGCIELPCDYRSLKLYRMPSSSRAYPMKLEKKAEFYRLMLSQTELLREIPQ